MYIFAVNRKTKFSTWRDKIVPLLCDMWRVWSWCPLALAKLSWSVQTIFRYKYQKCEASRSSRVAAGPRPRQLLSEDDALPSVIRCKFWPDCPNLKACTQHHPFEPCEKFPNCEAVLRFVTCFLFHLFKLFLRGQCKTYWSIGTLRSKTECYWIIVVSI